MAIKGFVFTVTPVLTAFACWWWYAGSRDSDGGLRRSILKWAVLAVTANVVLFYAWYVLRLIAGPADWVWTTQAIGRIVAEGLMVFAMAGSLVGKGAGRITVFGVVVFSLILWAPVGIL